MKKRTRRKIIILLLEIQILILLMTYAITKYMFQDIFCNNTIINGVDCSFLTVEEAKNVIQQKQDEYVFKIIFKDNEVENIFGTEIKLTIKNLEQELENIKERQRRSLLFSGKEYELENFFDEDKLKKVLSSKEQLKSEYMEKKTKIEYNFNSKSNLFELENKNIYYLDFNQVFEKVSKAISEKNNAVQMQDLYLIPETYSNLNKLNSYIKAKIIYELPDGKKYELSADTLHNWLVQDKNGKYVKDEEVWNQNIENFVTDKLCALADTTGKTRKFKPTEKETEISVKGGNYGYQINKEEEIAKLKEELANQESITRTPCYAKTEISTEDNTLGKSYVEIDLTRQKVWVYVNGKLKVETDCVTGCVKKKHDTPTGIYTLTYKEKDRILRGDKLPNGKYSYQSHVDYWMPFNGGIGLHDASWRKKFGGDIYINSGSHGCINLPLEAAEKIYGIINKQMPIIVYKSE